MDGVDNGKRWGCGSVLDCGIGSFLGLSYGFVAKCYSYPAACDLPTS